MNNDTVVFKFHCFFRYCLALYINSMAGNRLKTFPSVDPWFDIADPVINILDKLPKNI